jgi:hypothetical protein
MAWHWLVLARSYALVGSMEHTTARLDELRVRIKAECGEIDAQCRQLGLKRGLESRERAVVASNLQP